MVGVAACVERQIEEAGFVVSEGEVKLLGDGDESEDFDLDGVGDWVEGLGYKKGLGRR